MSLLGLPHPELWRGEALGAATAGAHPCSAASHSARSGCRFSRGALGRMLADVKGEGQELKFCSVKRQDYLNAPAPLLAYGFYATFAPPVQRPEQKRKSGGALSPRTLFCL